MLKQLISICWSHCDSILFGVYISISFFFCMNQYYLFRRTWGKLLSEPIMTEVYNVSWRHYATMNKWLTHWGWGTHISVSNLDIVGSDNGLSPNRRQSIIWTDAGILLIRNFSDILSEIQTFSFKKVHLKMSSGKWRTFCLGLNMLILMYFSYGAFSTTAKFAAYPWTSQHRIDNCVLILLGVKSQLQFSLRCVLLAIRLIQSEMSSTNLPVFISNYIQLTSIANRCP